MIICLCLCLLSLSILLSISKEFLVVEIGLPLFVYRNKNLNPTNFRLSKSVECYNIVRELIFEYKKRKHTQPSLAALVNMKSILMHERTPIYFCDFKNGKTNKNTKMRNISVEFQLEHFQMFHTTKHMLINKVYRRNLIHTFDSLDTKAPYVLLTPNIYKCFVVITNCN